MDMTIRLRPINLAQTSGLDTELSFQPEIRFLRCLKAIRYPIIEQGSTAVNNTIIAPNVNSSISLYCNN
jgi:hypothetical protein